MRRGRIVRLHVIVALLTLLVLIAGHTAWAMGLFDRAGKEP